MKLSEALNRFDTIFLSGPIETRLKFEYGITDPAWKLMGTSNESILKSIFAQDIRVAQAVHAPFVIPATTFRASRHHLPPTSTVAQTNLASIKFATDLQKEFDSPTSPVISSASIGPMYNAYSVEKIPTIEEAKTYHQEQITILNASGVDFISAITLPSFNEAMGIALALMESTEKEYIIGFILNHDGLLLDGTKLGEAINQIDMATIMRRPLGYMIYCTYPAVLAKLDPATIPLSRLLGVKANASSLPLHKLDGSASLVADEPTPFAEALIQLKKRLGLKILGGCCGTSLEHLKEIIKLERKLSDIAH